MVCAESEAATMDVARHAIVVLRIEVMSIRDGNGESGWPGASGPALRSDSGTEFPISGDGSRYQQISTSTCAWSDLLMAQCLNRSDTGRTQRR